MSDKKPYTVTMTGTYFVFAESESEANDIVSEAILHIDKVDNSIHDSETHWAQAVILQGHYTTIVYDGCDVSDYDARIASLAGTAETHDWYLALMNTITETEE